MCPLQALLLSVELQGPRASDRPGKALQDSGSIQETGGFLMSLSFCPSQAGCENPTISLHVIGLNGPTHDLEMMPPDDPRMRSAMLESSNH